jgi:hypothetical protein
VPEFVSFMEFVELLSGSEQLRSDFAQDPDATLSTYGLQSLSPLDVQDAIALVEDNRTVDWSDAYGTGAAAGDSIAFGSGSPAATAPTYDVAPAVADAAPDPGPESPDTDRAPLEADDIAATELDDSGPAPAGDAVEDALHDHADLWDG